MLSVSHASTSLIDLFVREIDLPRLAFHQLASYQGPAVEIVKYCLGRDPQRRCRALNREAAVRPTHRIGTYTVDLDGRDFPACPQQPDILPFEGTAPGCDEVLAVEGRRNLAIHLAGAVKFDDPSPQPLNVNASKQRRWRLFGATS